MDEESNKIRRPSHCVPVYVEANASDVNVCERREKEGFDDW